MKCLNELCSNVLTGRQRTFCSDKCRKAVSRTKRSVEDAPQSSNSDRPDHKSDTLSGFQPKSDNSMDYTVILGAPTAVIPPGTKAQASDPEVQAIWNRRNAQGQPSLYGDWPDRSKLEAI